METVSVVIPVRDPDETFNRLIDILHHQSHEVEILPLVSGKDFHHSRTRNLGADNSAGEFILFMTQDAVPQDNRLVARLLEPFKDPAIAVTYARQVPRLGAPVHIRFWHEYYFPPGEPPNEMYVSDVCAMYRRSAWAGYRFSEDVDMIEDKEIAARMMKGGWRIQYVPKAVVIHSHNHTLAETRKRSKQSGAALGKSPNIPIYPLDRIRFWLKEIVYVLGHEPLKLPYTLAYEAIQAKDVIRARYLK